MKHNIRIKGEVKEIDCELGSGILDKNGREIFDGDKIKGITDDGQIFTGYVEEIDDSWLVVVRANLIVKPANRLADLDDIEILDSD